MKLQNRNKVRYQKAVNLYSDGYTNKEIAQTLNVTEKTIGNWLKPIKAQKSELQKARTNLLKRINKAIEDGEPYNVINGLAHSLTMLKGL